MLYAEALRKYIINYLYIRYAYRRGRIERIEFAYRTERPTRTAPTPRGQKNGWAQLLPQF